MRTLFWYLDVKSRFLMLRSLRLALVKCVISSSSTFRDEALFRQLIRYLDKEITLLEDDQLLEDEDSNLD